MQIHTKAIGLDLTPSFNEYIEEKLGGLRKFIQRFDEEGVAELWLEVARTTNHHHKGEVYKASADLKLPKKILRAEHEAIDPRAAVDAVKDTLHLEIQKYKDHVLEHPHTSAREK